MNDEKNNNGIEAEDIEAIEENQDITDEKPKRSVVGRVFKIGFTAIVVLVWAAIISTIFLRSDDKILKTPILSERAREIYSSAKDDFEFYNVYPQIFMTKDGSVQLAETVYAAGAGELEIGVRIAWTQLRYCVECDRLYTPEQLEKQLEEDKKKQKEDENYSPAACLKVHAVERASLKQRQLYYTLTDSDGNIYPQAGRKSRTKNLNLLLLNIKYEYERVCFSGLYFRLDKNIINTAGESTPENGESEPADKGKGTEYYLNCYDKKGGSLLFSACVYSDGTFINPTTYQIPKSEYLN
ncbi:MAG: hypothetical protein WCR95_04225 [Eubacteriales bacterium]